MSEPLPELQVLRPTTTKAALADLAAHPDARLLAGGTDLLVNLRHGLGGAGVLVDLGANPALGEMDIAADGARIGAGVTLARLAKSDALKAGWPAVRQAAEAVAGPTHCEAATVGGNLCLDTRCLYYNQSEWWRKSNAYCLKYRGDVCHVAPRGNRCRAAFCGDLAPALMVCGAMVEIAGPAGLRQIPLAQLYQEDGAAHLTLDVGEILVAVLLPAPIPAPNPTSAYGKIRVRGAIDFPLAGVGVALTGAGDTARVSLAFTGTNSCPVMVEMPGPVPLGAERDAYFGALEKLAQKTVSPQRTTTAQPHFRRLAVATLARRLAEGICGERAK